MSIGHLLRTIPAMLASRDVEGIEASFARLAEVVSRQSPSEAHEILNPSLELAVEARDMGYGEPTLPLLDALWLSGAVEISPDRELIDGLLLGRAVLRAELHQFSEAIQLFEELLSRASRDPGIRQSALSHLGSLYSQVGDPRALDMLREGISVAAAAFGNASSEAAYGRVQLARAILEAGGDLRAGESLARQAAAELDRYGDPLPRSFARDVLGRSLQLLGDYRASRAAFEEAWAIMQRDVDPRHPAQLAALGNLASACFAQGDYAQAESLYSVAYSRFLEVFGDADPSIIPLLWNLAQVRTHTGDREGADRLLQRIEKMLPSPSAPAHSLGLVFLKRGDLASKRADREAARRYFQESERQLRQTPFADMPLAELATLERESGNLAEAELLLERVVKIHKSRGTENSIEFGFILLQQAHIALAKSDWSLALTKSRGAAEFFTRSFSPGYIDLVPCLEVQAFALLGAQQPAVAAEVIRKILELHERHFRNLIGGLSVSRQEQLIGRFHNPVELAVATHLNHALHDSFCFRVAFDALIRRKAISVEVARQRLRHAESTLDPAHQNLLQRLRETYQAIGTFYLLRNENVGRTLPRNNINDLLEEREALEQALPQSLFRDIKTLGKTDLDFLQASLPPGSVYLDYVYYRSPDPSTAGVVREEEWYGVYWVTAEGKRGALRLAPAATVLAVATRFISSMQQADMSVYFVAAIEAYNLLIAPLPEPARAANRLYVCPDAILYCIPFAALCSSPGSQLIASSTVMYVDSARELIHRDPCVESTQGPVIVGDPDYDANPTGEQSGVGLGANPDGATWEFFPVAGAAEELDVLHRLLPAATFWLGAEASKERMFTGLHGPIVLHVIAQGAYLAGEDRYAAMANSVVALAGANTFSSGVRLGTLTGVEASLLNLHGCELAVLSACETGLGQVQGGFGMFGLRRGLAIAGTRSQLVSLWRVDGEATAALMAQFYLRLTKGLPREAAFREAQLCFAERNVPPVFWAGFVLFGASGQVGNLNRSVSMGGSRR